MDDLPRMLFYALEKASYALWGNTRGNTPAEAGTALGGPPRGFRKASTLIYQTSDQRLAQMAKRHVDQLLRQGIGGEPLREAWLELHETVKGQTQ